MPPKIKPSEVATASPQNGTAQPYRENPQTNEKIDAWIKDNPERWAYFSGLPPERAARKLVLNEIQKYERQQKMNAGVMRKLDGDPEAKQAYETLLKRLPEDERERAMASVARHVLRITSPREQKPQATGMGVAA
jgi:hypothetical protein